MAMAPSTPSSGSGKKVRKPYTITKSRESWSEEEHDKFLEALQLWVRILNHNAASLHKLFTCLYSRLSYFDYFQLFNRKGTWLNKIFGRFAVQFFFSLWAMYQRQSDIELLTFFLIFFWCSDLTEIGRKLRILLVQKQLFRLGSSSSAMFSWFVSSVMLLYVALSLNMCFLQIRSHAQKYFLKVQKNGTAAHVPPPRPKRKAAHPYPQKTSKNGLLLFHTIMFCSLKS